MWIKKKKFLELEKRISVLEQIEQERKSIELADKALKKAEIILKQSQSI